MRSRFKQHSLQLLIRWVAFPLLKLYLRLCHWQWVGLSEFNQASRERKIILALWHESLPLVAYLAEHAWPDLTLSAPVSASRDGQLLQAVLAHLNNLNLISVGHDRRHGALKGIIDCLNQGHLVIITPDGPRGPWKVAKHGVYRAAHHTKAELWAMRWEEGGTWRLPTPDGMRLPKFWVKNRITLQPLPPIEDRMVDGEHLLERCLNRGA